MVLGFLLVISCMIKFVVFFVRIDVGSGLCVSDMLVFCWNECIVLCVKNWCSVWCSFFGVGVIWYNIFRLRICMLGVVVFLELFVLNMIYICGNFVLGRVL